MDELTVLKRKINKYLAIFIFFLSALLFVVWLLDLSQPTQFILLIAFFAFFISLCGFLFSKINTYSIRVHNIEAISKIPTSFTKALLLPTNKFDTKLRADNEISFVYIRRNPLFPYEQIDVLYSYSGNDVEPEPFSVNLEKAKEFINLDSLE